MATANKPDSHRLSTVSEVATRLEVAYDVILTASILFPKEISTRPGYRDKLHKAVDALKELSEETRKMVDEGEVWFG